MMMKRRNLNSGAGTFQGGENLGLPFLQIFKEIDRDSYETDATLFASAVLIKNNTKTGKIFGAGGINPEVLTKSLGF